MNAYETVLEDLLAEDDEDFLEDEDDFELDDDLSERRRKRRPRRRPPRIRAGKTAQGRGFFKTQSQPRPVSSTSLQASLERVGKDIRTNAAAIKRLEAEAKAATAKLTTVNNTQDGVIRDLRSDLKKQTSSAQQQNQMNMLLPLLQKTPELEIRPGLDPTAQAAAQAIVGSVQVKKQDNTLALVLMMMASGQTGGPTNNMNMMLPMLLLMDK